MQILVQVICTSGPSLRDSIAGDSEIDSFQLKISEQKRHGRSPGWTKIHSINSERRGAINIQWDPAISILNCRVVTKGNSRPGLIIGDFTNYLLSRHRRRVQSVSVVPRK